MKNRKVAIITISAIIILIVIISMGVLNASRKLLKNKKTDIEQKALAESSSVSNSSIDIGNWDTSKVNIVYDTEGVAVPVPIGYVASSVDGQVGKVGRTDGNYQMGEHTVRTGFVIYEGTDPVTDENAWEQSQIRNQWVWIPVPDSSRIYEVDAETGKKKAKLWTYTSTGRETYINNNCEPGVLLGVDNEKYFSTFNLQGLTKEKFLEELQIEFEETIKSIEKYGGFYIGRYETGDITQNDKVPVVKRLNSNTEMDQASWYHEYNILKNIQIKDNVKSNMIWGCLWDETLQWLVDSGNKTNEEIINSSIWGNHKGVDIEYITASGNVRTKYGNEEYNNIPTGSSEYSNSNNIYDIAGNGTEITLEKRPNFEVQRMSRGGTTTTTAEKESVSFRRISDVGNRAGSSMVRSTCILIYKIKVAKKIIFSKP